MKVRAVSLQVRQAANVLSSEVTQPRPSIEISPFHLARTRSGKALLLVPQRVHVIDAPLDYRKEEDIVPCSDMAGEVVAVGADVTEWKQGDRVCANFCTDHLAGPPTKEIAQTSLGGQSPGVLTQYRTFPAHVRRSRSLLFNALAHCSSSSLWSSSRAT